MKYLILIEKFYKENDATSNIVKQFCDNCFSENDEIILFCYGKNKDVINVKNMTIHLVQTIDAYSQKILYNMRIFLHKIARKMKGIYRSEYYPKFFLKSLLNFVNHNSVDKIIAFSGSFSMQILAAKINKKTNIPFCSYLTDPYLGNINFKDINNKTLVKRESKWLSHATSIAMPSNYYALYNSYYPNYANKIYIIEFPLNMDIYNFKPKTKFLNNNYFLQVGTFYPKARPYRDFLQICECFKSIKNLKIYNCGCSPWNAKNNSITCLENISKVDKYEYAYLLTNSSALILMDNIYGIQIPSKTFEYILSRRPILFFYRNTKSPTKLLLERYTNSLMIDLNSFDLTILAREVTTFVQSYNSAISNSFFEKYSNSKIFELFIKFIKS